MSAADRVTSKLTGHLIPLSLDRADELTRRFPVVPPSASTSEGRDWNRLGLKPPAT